jgi:Domain of unknown function (DUF6249)
MMHRMIPATRRLMLGAAFAAALAVWLIPQPPVARATAHRDDTAVIAQAEPKAPAAAPKDAAKATDDTVDATIKKVEAAVERAVEQKGDAEVTIDQRGIIIEKGKKRVRVDAFGHDREYESFEDFVRDAPWLAGLVFTVVLLVFLVPLLVIVLLVWYKVRKNRMLNETMIKLAEKGVMPPAEAMEALTASKVGPAVTAGPSTAPLYEQAKLIRRRAAWSDLRKGVIMVALGFGLSAYSMLDDGTPNGLGLVLLFVGVGYCVLWYFEEREPASRPAGSPPAGGTPPSGGA